MMMFFRKFGDRLSDFITPDTDETSNTDPRVAPWGLGFDADFNYILRHSKKLRIINPDKLADMQNVAELHVLTEPNIRLLLPYGNHMVALEHKNNAYAFPYVIVGERERDCRLFVFEDANHIMSWMLGLKEGADFDKLNQKFLSNMRVFRLMFNAGEILVKGSTAINDIEVDTSTWSKPGTYSNLTQCIIKPINREGVTVFNPQFLRFDNTSFKLDDYGHFIKDWRYNGK